MKISGENIRDTLPCRHGFPSHSIETAKNLLRRLPETSPELLRQANITEEDWLPLLRAAIESMRGTSSATGTDKQRFISAVLKHCAVSGTIDSWAFIGSRGRQDYRVTLPDGTAVAIEAKGCPDGNNTTIWDRPSWADEFIVWSLCPESLAHDPGKGVWSGISTRLMPKIAAERKVVDAFVFWDGRCGTTLRQCPKGYGVKGPLRAEATDLPGQAGKEDWVPPPCIYMFPRSVPSVPHNLKPPIHTARSCKFTRALLNAFAVPEDEHSAYVHDAGAQVKGSNLGTEIQITTVSRCWPDGNERVMAGRWKELRREA
ncbi:hypothetical protein [Micromonospora chersina]|uniref:hypothetical protein n=1 Tax=Micromonospora chersina TaxID=47854 RepID=UPI00371D1DB2